jgi:hypothetical protein
VVHSGQGLGSNYIQARVPKAVLDLDCFKRDRAGTIRKIQDFFLFLFLSFHRLIDLYAI